MYSIKVRYDTGDSFESHKDCENVLSLRWTSLEVAKENLQRIKEHWQYYKTVHKGSFYGDDLDHEAIKELLKDKPWINKKYDCAIILVSDDGRDIDYSCSVWCGYFDQLNSAEIIQVEDDGDSDMKFKDAHIPYLSITKKKKKK